MANNQFDRQVINLRERPIAPRKRPAPGRGLAIPQQDQELGCSGGTTGHELFLKSGHGPSKGNAGSCHRWHSTPLELLDAGRTPPQRPRAFSYTTAPVSLSMWHRSSSQIWFPLSGKTDTSWLRGAASSFPPTSEFGTKGIGSSEGDLRRECFRRHIGPPSSSSPVTSWSLRRRRPGIEHSEASPRQLAPRRGCTLRLSSVSRGYSS